MAVKVRDIEVGKLIGESSKFRLYIGQLPDDRKVLVKIAKTFEDNSNLLKDAQEFSMLKTFENHLRQFPEFSSAGAIDYNLLFAELFSSFVEETQKDRRLNVFILPDINLEGTTPLSKLYSQLEIDARTSVWILGRLFKFYGMFELKQAADEDDACHYPIFSDHDYFIDPKAHRLIYFNFSGEVYNMYATSRIKTIASYILNWIVFDDSEENIKYKALLQDFVSGGRTTFAEAHEDLYDLVREIWGIKYYPFTYRYRGTEVWKNVEEEKPDGTHDI